MIPLLVLLAILLLLIYTLGYSILAFVAVLAVLILIHELGHFLTAKAYKVKVLEFGFGLPPQILSFPRRAMISSLEERVAAFQRDETVYSLNALPVGGFVRLTGEDTLELRLLLKGTSQEDLEQALQALRVVQASLTETESKATITLLEAEVGPVTLADVVFAQKERAEVLVLGVEVEPEARSAAQRRRIRVTLADSSLSPAEAVRRLTDGFAAEVRHGLTSKGVLTRAVILGAGSFMNFVLPLAIFAFIFMLPTDRLEGHVHILGVAPGSPAEQAGIRKGDIVLRVDGHPVANTAELAYRIRLKLGKSTTWVLVREKPRITGFVPGGGDPWLIPTPSLAESTSRTVHLVPRWKPPPEEGNAGILIATQEARLVSQSYPLWEAVPKGFVRMGETLLLFRNEIIGMVIGANDRRVGGVIAIGQITGEVARAGWTPTMELVALLSLNLAILNILPIPALDGGRLLFVVIEWFRRGKRIPPERERVVHLVGFALLISFMVVISYFDILRIIRGESLLR